MRTITFEDQIQNKKLRIDHQIDRWTDSPSRSKNSEIHTLRKQNRLLIEQLKKNNTLLSQSLSLEASELIDENNKLIESTSDLTNLPTFDLKSFIDNPGFRNIAVNIFSNFGLKDASNMRSVSKSCKYLIDNHWCPAQIRKMLETKLTNDPKSYIYRDFQRKYYSQNWHQIYLYFLKPENISMIYNFVQLMMNYFANYGKMKSYIVRDILYFRRK